MKEYWIEEIEGFHGKRYRVNEAKPKDTEDDSIHVIEYAIYDSVIKALKIAEEHNDAMGLELISLKSLLRRLQEIN